MHSLSSLQTELMEWNKSECVPEPLPVLPRSRIVYSYICGILDVRTGKASD